MAGNARGWVGVNLLNVAAISTTTNGAATDLATYANLAKREMKVVFFLSGTAGTTISITPSVQECATTNGTYAAPTYYTAASAQTTDGMVELNFRADKRYIQAVATLGANTTGANVSAVAFVLKREANS